MIDLHTHVLPGIDDGAEDLNEAVAMCRLAAETGCKAIVATPHQRVERWWNNDPEALSALRREVQHAVGTDLRIFSGGEIRIDSELLGELDDLPTSGLLSLAGSRYLLLEFDRRGLGLDPENLIHELAISGWRPILAHPELIPALADDFGLLHRLLDLGAHLQVTAMSLTSGFGAKTERIARRMIDADLVDFVASDTHGVKWRPPGLHLAYEAIRSTWGEDAARAMTSTNPRAVVQDRPLHEPVETAPTMVQR